MLAVLKPKGIHCPQCLAPDLTPTSRRRPMPGLRVRYFVCNKCSHRFRTSERISGPTKKPWNGQRAEPGTAT